MVGFDPLSAWHMFRDTPGHVIDTEENRRLLAETAKPEFRLGVDQFQSEWFARPYAGGQLWVLVREGYIRNGGWNAVPRTFNALTGLSAREPRHGRTDR